MSVSPLPSGPTQRQRETWEAVQRLGSQVAAANELGITQAGVQGNLRGYMAHMGIEGEMPGRLSAEEMSRIRTEGGRLGGRPRAAKPEKLVTLEVQPEALPIGVIRNGRTIPAVAAEPRDPDADTVNTYSFISHEENASGPRGVIGIEPDEPAIEPETETQPDLSSGMELSERQSAFVLGAAMSEVVNIFRGSYTGLTAAERIVTYLRDRGFDLFVLAVQDE